jgi:hypothetical protein
MPSATKLNYGLTGTIERPGSTETHSQVSSRPTDEHQIPTKIGEGPTNFPPPRRGECPSETKLENRASVTRCRVNGHWFLPTGGQLMCPLGGFQGSMQHPRSVGYQ